MFIIFEGGEGCGKSTQIKLLADRLEKVGLPVLLLREPGGTPLGEKLRHMLKHDPDAAGISPETQLMLLSASRAELVRKVIRPALEDGTWVLCDRFIDSTVAYQGGGHGIDLGEIYGLENLVVGDTRPDITFWLRVPEEIARERIQKRREEFGASVDRYDSETDEFFARVEYGYSKIEENQPLRFLPVDGTGTVEEVSKRIFARLLQESFKRFSQLLITPSTLPPNP